MDIRLWTTGIWFGALLSAIIGMPRAGGAAPYDPSLRLPNRQFPAAAQGPAAAVSGNLLLNPSFEMNGGVGTDTFADWTVFDNNVNGSFFVQAGNQAPFIDGSHATVPPPPDGDFAAMSDQSGPGLRLIYQDVTLPPGTFRLSCEYFINAEADYRVPDPETLDPTVFPNEHARIDIMDPAAPVDDVGAGVLKNILLTRPGDPGDPEHPMTGYARFSALFAGDRTVRVRFAEVDNLFFFNFGIDGCVLERSEEVKAPALTAVALAAVAAALLAIGAFGLSRRRRHSA